MTDIERALIEYDGDNGKPYCDLAYRALKEMRDRENPKPLTLDQLNKRKGKWVWADSDNENYFGWGRVIQVHPMISVKILKENPGYLHTSNVMYYDYPPKEETD